MNSRFSLDWKGEGECVATKKNNNGSVDNILELFGKTNKTGTQELREYDLNSDGVINSNDSVFSELRVWQDFNQNGLSEAGELKSLTDLGITAINVSEESLTPRNQISEGNLVISEGTYTQTTTNPDGSTSQSTRSYANLDLAVNQTNSSSYTYAQNAAIRSNSFVIFFNTVTNSVDFASWQGSSFESS
ncbi:MAG: hypothetical protein KGP29_05440 [Proteobacteria bacterium]|nr:hypothetical protein [Pseudomonadota bacterium]